MSNLKRYWVSCYFVKWPSTTNTDQSTHLYSIIVQFLFNFSPWSFCTFLHKRFISWLLASQQVRHAFFTVSLSLCRHRVESMLRFDPRCDEANTTRVKTGYQVLSTYLFCKNTYPIHTYLFINTYLLHTFGSLKYIPFYRYAKYDVSRFYCLRVGRLGPIVQ